MKTVETVKLWPKITFKAKIKILCIEQIYAIIWQSLFVLFYSIEYFFDDRLTCSDMKVLIYFERPVPVVQWTYSKQPFS